jgi:hypothetical protein
MEANEITVNVMEWLSATANQVGNFAKEEIPPFIHEFLAWKFFETTIDAAWSLVYIIPILIFFFFYSKKAWAWGVKYGKQSDGCSLLLPSVATVIAFIGLVVAFPLDEIKTMVKIKTAPKVYLIEEAANIIQTIRKESK